MQVNFNGNFIIFFYILFLFLIFFFSISSSCFRATNEFNELPILPNIKKLHFDCCKSCLHMKYLFNCFRNISELNMCMYEITQRCPKLYHFHNLKKLVFQNLSIKENNQFWFNSYNLESLTLRSEKLTQRILYNYLEHSNSLREFIIFRSRLKFTTNLDNKIRQLIKKRKNKKSLMIRNDRQCFHYCQ